MSDMDEQPTMFGEPITAEEAYREMRETLGHVPTLSLPWWLVRADSELKRRAVRDEMASRKD